MVPVKRDGGTLIKIADYLETNSKYIPYMEI
jgi:hypothetical protein